MKSWFPQNYEIEKKFGLMPENAQNCENKTTYFKQNYTQKQLIAF